MAMLAGKHLQENLNHTENRNNLKEIIVRKHGVVNQAIISLQQHKKAECFLLCEWICILWNVFLSLPRPRRVSHLPGLIFPVSFQITNIYTHMPKGKVVSYTVIFIVTL